ncbi:MAG: hypothetical protein ACREL2_05265 [Gemmatimonadales bacterium]
MTCGWISRSFLLTGLVAGIVALPAAAQVRWEVGIEAAGLAADPGFVGAGLWGAVRPSERLRLGLAVLGGARRDAAVRGEFVAHFLLDPARRSGAGLYGGGGVAAESGGLGQAWIVAVLGLEGRPGGRSGLVVEFGVGGGVRVSVGWRWRRRG